MQIDNTTYKDLLLFSNDEEYSIFHRLDFTRTVGGKSRLASIFTEPFSEIRKIMQVQAILKLILLKENEWPQQITNGTVMVMEKFYETSVHDIPSSPGLVHSVLYKIFNGPDYSVTRYSVTHFADFLRGMQLVLELLKVPNAPGLLLGYTDRARSLMKHKHIEQLIGEDPSRKLSPNKVLYYGRFLRTQYKRQAEELIEIYSQLDAWYSMAVATKRMNLKFPSFSEQEEPLIEARGLYHVLLADPVAYDVELTPHSNFLFLTGANMAGKSTFIKAVGAAVFLAHIGMGVPASNMQLTVFDGVLSNINVEDNIVKGESFFFNEVQRIKNTILKINDHRKWLILIDELFKGTNVQDAMKCSTTVIKGLLKIRNSLFILSTHLYEIADELKAYPNISFKYFETTIRGEQLEFSYQLKDGISDDRLGYLILRREKVIDLLDSL